MLKNLPPIPEFKKYGEKMTPEQNAILKLIQLEKISFEEEKGLKECIDFYKICFEELEKINLSELKPDIEIELKEYLRYALPFTLPVINKITFDHLYRVSVIKKDFLDAGKVRDVKFLSHPSIELNKKLGLYNRANSPNTTVLYASFFENVAFMETKPKVGERIILTHWYNNSKEKFNSYPVPNIETINNESLKKASQAFKSRKDILHPLLFEILDLVLLFISKQYVKEVICVSQYRYEYLFSAYFSEQVLLDKNIENLEFIDCIIYPSVAYKHLNENLAIHPKSVSKLQILNATEILITKTKYDNVKTLDDQPIEGKIIRKSVKIENDKIIWNDD